MKKLITMMALAVVAGGGTVVHAQGTYSNEGETVDRVKAAVAAYLEGDWNAYRSAFADTASFYASTTEAISLKERIEEHAALNELFDDIQFVNPVYGEVKNEGETWGLMWGTWSAKDANSGEEISVPVHIAILFVGGKGVVEYGFWDTAPIQAAMEAAQGR